LFSEFLPGTSIAYIYPVIDMRRNSGLKAVFFRVILLPIKITQMKRIILLALVLLAITGVSMAQVHHPVHHRAVHHYHRPVHHSHRPMHH
jgi:hypothetical protein